ncbi:MAG: dephospho-CoA kinase [Gammaproteobacteria bacterium]
MLKFHSFILLSCKLATGLEVVLKIGLTGGVASGKTTISNLFSQQGVPIIDTDILSRRLLEIDQPGYAQAVQHFGNGILQQDGQIDRRQLRHLIFSSEAEKQWLETILHPMIYHQTQHQIAQNSSADYVIVVIPLLFEANFQSLIDRILVVDCSEQTQIERLTRRDKIDPELASKMLAQQWSNTERMKQADDVIGNDQNQNLEEQVDSLHEKYTSMAINGVRLD